MRMLRAVVVAVVLLIAFAYGFARITDDDRPVRTRRELGKGLAALTISTSNKIRLSPDGERLAIVEAGAVTVVGVDDAKVVTRAGTNVVDAAWMPDGERVLVVEGPIPTGQLTVIDMEGTVSGVAQLSPSVSFGTGLGLAVDSRGTQAAVITVTREPIGGRQHSDLAVVGLQTGKVRVYATPERDETQPMFVDDELVAVSSVAETGGARLDLVDVASGQVQAGPELDSGPFVRTFRDEVVVGRRAPGGADELVAVDTQTLDTRRLHVTERRRRVVAIDLQVTRAVVRVSDPGGEAHLEIEAFADSGSG